MSAVARLYPLRAHPVQARLKASPARFKVVPAGRRSGKTELAKRKLVKSIYEAIKEMRWPDARFFAAAPTRDQAKAIYWADLKAMVPREHLAEAPRETELMLRTAWGTELHVIGLDKPQRMEGRPWDGGVIDEDANAKPGAWPENVRPALSDRGGWCWLIGVPEGRNHYYDLWKYAISGTDPEWEGFTWKSADILPAAEVASARRSLDPLVFEQEYEASFVNFTGRAYYPFSESIHADPRNKLGYDDKRELALCFDFNVDPGVCVVVQEQVLPGQYERDAAGLVMLDRPIWGTGVIGEVWIPQNSNTPAVCKRVLTDWGRHQGPVAVYGDASGGSRGTAQTEGSDWDLIRKHLSAGMGDLQGFGDRLDFRVPNDNPAERARINAVNTRLLTSDGSVHLMVDASAAPNTVRDLEGVRTLEGGSGEIDKKHDKRLTHVSDALGYYIEREFPVSQRSVEITTLRL